MTTAPPKVSQEDLSKLVDASQQSSFLYLCSRVNEHTYQVFPTGSLDDRIVIEKCSYRTGDASSIRTSVTRYFLSKSPEGVIEGYALDIGENGLGLYKRSNMLYVKRIERKESKAQKLLNRIMRRKYEVVKIPTLEEFGVRRDISSSEAIEVAAIIRRLAEEEKLHDDAF